MENATAECVEGYTKKKSWLGLNDRHASSVGIDPNWKKLMGRHRPLARQAGSFGG